MTNTTEIQALQNAADCIGMGVKVYLKHYDDKRKSIKMYFLHDDQTGETLSPVLDYENLNHFILGFIKAKKYLPINKK